MRVCFNCGSANIQKDTTIEKVIKSSVSLNKMFKVSKHYSQCNDCQALGESVFKPLKCDVGGGHISCIVQSGMIKKGFVLDYDFSWRKKDSFKGEVQLESVDWIHMHSSPNCCKVYETVDPKGYLKTCKSFGVEP